MGHHGDSFTRLYSIWQNMKLRCLNSEWSKFYKVSRGKLYRYYKVGKPFVINGKVKQWQKSD